MHGIHSLLGAKDVTSLFFSLSTYLSSNQPGEGGNQSHSFLQGTNWTTEIYTVQENAGSLVCGSSWESLIMMWIFIWELFWTRASETFLSYITLGIQEPLAFLFWGFSLLPIIFMIIPFIFCNLICYLLLVVCYKLIRLQCIVLPHIHHQSSVYPPPHLSRIITIVLINLRNCWWGPHSSTAG